MTNPVLSTLPAVVHVRSDADASDWIGGTLALLRRELQTAAPGARAVVERLTDVLITQALRSALSGQRSVMLLDPVLASAVRLLQERPAHAWTIDELGRHVGLSRTALAGRFRASTGESPMRYLNRVRLTRAAATLASGDATLYGVAQSCGYASESSFSRAFKRAFGVSPGRYRREEAAKLTG